MATCSDLTRARLARDLAPGGRCKSSSRALAGAALLAVLSGAGDAPVAGQVTAQQGAPQIESSKRFTSPMVLTIPLPALTSAKELRGLSVAGIRSYRCEDASIAAMTVSVSTARKGARTYEFAGLLLVDESFDRLVSLTLELRDSGGKVLVSGRQLNISVEEGKSARFLIRTEVSSERAALIDGSGELSLQITMNVRKD
jgi:hypothetical protein